MAFESCPRCGESVFDWDTAHRCMPPYKVVCPAVDPERIYEIRAIDAIMAAERWAEQYDSSDIPIIASGEVMTIQIQAPRQSKWTSWFVSGHWVPSYRAQLITDQDIPK